MTRFTPPPGRPRPLAARTMRAPRFAPLRATLVAITLGIAAAGCVPAIIAGGIGTAAYMANDRRTNETMLADERIERTINSRIKNEIGESARVNVNVFNRIVLLSGEARTPADKEQAAYIAKMADGSIRGIHNEVDVTAFRAPREQFSDGTITTQVKARMVGNPVFNALHVQASTDGGVVYLQGLVTKAEANEAARVASTTQGVKKVVRLFEVLPDDAPQVKPK